MPPKATASKDRAQRSEALIARMKKARGYIYSEWEFAARKDPDFVEAYNRIYELGLGDGRHVSAKVREFIAIALLAFRGSEKGALVAHMQRRCASARRARSCSRCSRRVWFRAAPRRFIAG